MMHIHGSISMCVCVCSYEFIFWWGRKHSLSKFVSQLTVSTAAWPFGIFSIDSCYINAKKADLQSSNFFFNTVTLNSPAFAIIPLWLGKLCISARDEEMPFICVKNWKFHFLRYLSRGEHLACFAHGAVTGNNSLEHYLCINFLTRSRPQSVTVHSATGWRREGASAVRTCTEGVVGPQEDPGNAFITYNEGRLVFSETVTYTAVPRVPSDFSC